MEGYASHWLELHADIARAIRGLRGHVVNLVRDPDLAGWDGMAETWFDSEEHAIAGSELEPVRSGLGADRPKFPGEVGVFFVDRQTVVPQTYNTGG
jgi:hypothetical protein